MAFRHDVVAAAEEILLDIALAPLDDAALIAAETIPPPTVATLDAIHLATAVRLARAEATSTRS